MTQLDTDTLKELAKLCRIKCTEFEQLQNNLLSILSYIDQMQEVDTEGVPTCNYIHDTTMNTLREDQVGQPLPRDTFLENSPAHIGGMIRVPPVIKF